MPTDFEAANLPPARITTALFDYDGTLMDTDPVHWQCWNTALGAFGASLDRPSYDALAGQSTRRIAETLARRAGLAVDASDIITRKETAFADWLRTGSVPWMPAAETAFRRFQRHGATLAVVTSSPRALVRVGLEQRGIAGDLDALVCRDDVTHGKPAPDCYRLAMERLGAHPPSTVVFEDTRSGVQAAVAAGLHCIAVRPPHVGPQDFPGALRVFGTMQEAADWLLGPDGAGKTK